MYELEKRVGYSELDTQGKMSLRALLNAYQDCATMHTEDKVYRLQDMIKKRRGWFVVSYQLKNYRMPIHGEKIVIKTLPLRVKGFMGLRLFYLEDEKGNLLAEAYSEWVFMDLENLRPVRVTEDMISGYNPEDRDTSQWADRKIKLDEGMEREGSFVVEKLFVDTNGHMNNAYYIDIALEVMEKKDYQNIRIEFKQSATYGDNIIIKKNKDTNKPMVSMENEEGKVFCIVEFSD